MRHTKSINPAYEKKRQKCMTTSQGDRLSTQHRARYNCVPKFGAKARVSA